MDENDFSQQRKLRFSNFLEPNSGTEYSNKIMNMLDNEQSRLAVNLNDLRSFDPEEAKHLLTNPMACIPAYEDALKTFVENHIKDGGLKIKLREKYHVAVLGSFGSHRMGPRQIMASSLTQLVCVEGIVTKCSLVRPKVVRTVHYCEATGEFKTQNFRDATSFQGAPTGAAYPTTDDHGNRLTTEFGLCTYRNHQRIFIQDMPERTAPGTMPRTIECIVEDDLVDNCKPGDRIQMIGVYRALSNAAKGEHTGTFRTVVIANNIRRIGRDEHSREIVAEDISNIRGVLKKHRRDLFDILARSIAPTIYGHDFIKKAVVLMLLGGVEKNLKNGTHIRGDINLLMVGDPSTAKSQLLRAVMQIGDLVINTTGRGSSGVGLTAAVTMDRDSGERRLEAGAMVLADRGIVCIDEFDKMSDADRTAIHEVMEQQTVTIAKAGIHTSLNARCSVIAASNPIYGQYNRQMKPAQNIALPDSLLSRFDLLFIVLDKLDPRIDRAISEHVLRMHRYQGKELTDVPESDSEPEDLNKGTEVYEKRDKLLQGAAARLRKKDGLKKLKFLTSAFCRKFIDFAKRKAIDHPPILTDDARESIAQKYAELRGEGQTQTLPITARCLETIIRLSTAHAKMRISTEIETQDVDAVFRVMKYALTNDADPGGNPVPMEDEEEDEKIDEDGDVEMEDDEPAKRKPKRKKPDMHSSPASKKAQKNKSGDNASKNNAKVDPRTQEVTKYLAQLFRERRTGFVEVKEFVDMVEKESKFGFTSRKEVEKVVDAISKSEKVFITQGRLYRV